MFLIKIEYNYADKSEFRGREITMNHVNRAKELFEQKYHCSQAVLAAFADELGITEKQALKIGGCFGGGMCKGEVCGACTGALMVLGLKYGQCEIDDLDSRLKTNDVTVRFLELFRNENGSYLCKELLGCDLAPQEGKVYAREHNLIFEFCRAMVACAVKIVEQLIK